MLAWFESRINPFEKTAPTHFSAHLGMFIWQATHGVRRYIAALVFVAACIGAFEALLFSALGSIVDELLRYQPEHLWAQQGQRLLWLGALLLGSSILVAAYTLIKHQVLAGNFPMLLRWRFHRLMLGQSMPFYQDEFAGRIATKVMQTALAVRDAVLIVSDILVFVTIYFLTMTAVVGRFYWVLMLPFIVWVLAYLLALKFFVPRLSRVSKDQADARSLMTGRITDAYTNIATVKLFSHADREATYARTAMREFLANVHQMMRFVSGFEFVNHILSMLLIVATAGVALWLWVHGLVGVGAVAAATAMALRLNGISHWIMWEMSNLFEHVGTVQDGLLILSKAAHVQDAPAAVALQVAQGEIRFNDVSFSYDGQQPIFDKLNLHIRPGEKIGLVGRSGAGKSTIVSLLLRFYDIDAGQILIDGQNIANVTQESLRAQIGMVTQDTALLHRSIKDNILYGSPDASDHAMYLAAEKAQAHQFIAEIKDPKGRQGYEAHVGERGVKLSGGQRQRIAIARVMLKDAPILVLDEATSALDSEIEAAIQNSLIELMQGKTVLAIAHRLSTIAAMDRLIVIDQGRIVEEGTHNQLLAQGGLYSSLWAHQSGGFLGEN